jgi:hypothetical protein
MTPGLPIHPSLDLSLRARACTRSYASTVKLCVLVIITTLQQEGKGAGALKAPPDIGFASDPSLLTSEHGEHGGQSQ